MMPVPAGSGKRGEPPVGSGVTRLFLRRLAEAPVADRANPRIVLPHR